MSPPGCHQCGALLPAYDPHTTSCKFCGAPLAHVGEADDDRIPLTDDGVLAFLRKRLTGVDSGFIHPSIPEKKLTNARKIHAAHLPAGEVVLALYDGTAFGSANDGFVITSRRVCFKNTMDPPKVYEWVHVDEDEIYIDDSTIMLGRAKLETLYSDDDEDLYAWEEIFETLARSAKPPKPKPQRPADAWSSASAGGAAPAGGGAWGGMSAPTNGGPAPWGHAAYATPGFEQPDCERLAHPPYQVEQGCSLVDVHPSGEVVLAVGSETVEIHFAQNGARANAIKTNDSVLAARFSPDGSWLLLGGMDHRVSLHEARSGQPRGATQPMGDYVDEVAWIGRTSAFAMASQSGEVWIVDAQTMKETNRLLAADADHESLGGIAASADGARLFVAVGSRLGCFDVASGTAVWRRDDAPGGGRIAISPRGDLLFVAGWDGIALFDARTGHPGPRQQFRCARNVSWPEGAGGVFKKAEEGMYSWSPRPRFSPSGHAVVLQDHVGNLNFFDVPSGQLHTMGRDAGRAWIEDVAWFPDGEHVVVGSSDNTLALWRARPLVGVWRAAAIAPSGY
ncbi:MAG: WD40 repeat domain-containing protein [Polyangiaceae bacterium]|nr:WD40 repeat domain-containing protein [Polyangiaceae bacterium]